jgi:hypothetical protein
MSQNVKIVVEKTKGEILGGTKTALYFPSDLKSAPYYMVLTPIKYSRDAALSSDLLKKVSANNSSETPQRVLTTSESLGLGNVFAGKNRDAAPKAPTFDVKFEDGQMIALPLPTQLSDSLSLAYNTSDLGVTAAGFQAGQALGNSNLGLDDAIGVAGYATRTLANLSDSLGGLINLVTGNVPNPYSILQFKNVEQRTFSFDWTFAPNSEVESRSIREIMNTIRYLALPNQNGLFLEFPYEFEIQFVGTSFLYSMSRGYITDLKIEYGSPNGTAFFPIQDFRGLDGAPTQIRFSFTFKEIYPLNKTLIEKSGPSMAPNSTYAEPEISPQQPSPEAETQTKGGEGGASGSGVDPLGVFSPPKDKIEIGKMTPLEYQQWKAEQSALKKQAKTEIAGGG